MIIINHDGFKKQIVTCVSSTSASTAIISASFGDMHAAMLAFGNHQRRNRGQFINRKRNGRAIVLITHEGMIGRIARRGPIGREECFTVLRVCEMVVRREINVGLRSDLQKNLRQLMISRQQIILPDFGLQGRQFKSGFVLILSRLQYLE